MFHLFYLHLETRIILLNPYVSIFSLQYFKIGFLSLLFEFHFFTLLVNNNIVTVEVKHNMANQLHPTNSQNNFITSY